MDGQAQSNVPLQLFQSLGHKTPQIIFFTTADEGFITLFLPKQFVYMRARLFLVEHIVYTQTTGKITYYLPKP